jgi:hypothetical protein
MKKHLLFVFCTILFIISAFTSGYAQSASATWALTVDTSVVVAGNITAPVQVLSKTPIATDTMTVKDYVGGTPTSGSPVGLAERVWLNNTSWPIETANNSGRYIQYSVSPISGNNFTVQAVALNIGTSGTSHMHASISYSTDSTFATSTVLYDGISVLPDIRSAPLAAHSYTPNTNINSGQTFYLRINPWMDGSTSSTKYFCLTNVVISGTTLVPADSITLSTSSLSSFQQTVPVLSSTQSYTVSGGGLINNVTVTPPVGFEISADAGSTWYNHSSPLVITQIGGVLPGQPETILVRLNALSGGVYGGNITHSSNGALTKSVVVNGLALATEPTVSSAITFGSASGDSLAVNFSGGNGSYRILVARPNSPVSWAPTDGNPVNGVINHFFTATDQGSGNKVVYDGTGSSVIVTGLTSMTMYYFAVYEYNVGMDNSQNYLTTSPGTGSKTTGVILPTLSKNSALLSYGDVTVKAVSNVQLFLLSGSNLAPASGNITISAPDGYQVSTRGDVGFASSITIPYSNNGLAQTKIYSRFLPTAVQSYTGNITTAGGGATQNVAVTGAGVSTIVSAGLFVSTTGNDATGTGSIALPFQTIPKAISVANAGDTIFVRGGTYSINTTITISKSGTSSSKYCLFAYPGERPVLDFSSMAFGSSNRGINLSGHYWYIKGLEIYRAGDNGMNISGSDNIIEFCALYENQDSGLQLSGGAAHNRIINCDSYYNYDAPNSGGNADGFSPKLDVGTGNSFYACRSWQNSDDGWDCYGAVAAVAIENCWTFNNGYIKDGSDPGGNGNGFKMGGNYTENDATLTRCLSFGNKSKGFDQNHDRGSMTLVNCTGYNNVEDNYSISEALDAGKTLTITNCAELGNKRSIGAFAILTTNSWPTFTVIAADFVSLDTAGVRGPRKADGSLPDISFMHLATSSQLIGAGTYVGLPFNGSAPDLGCFESDYVTGVDNQNGIRISDFKLLQNYPNPFNPSTLITFYVRQKGFVKLQIVNILGQHIQTLFAGQADPQKQYDVVFQASTLPSGVYFSILESNGERLIRKMLLVK